MKIRAVIKLVAIAAVILFTLPTPLGSAAGNQSNQALNQAALLVAPDEPNRQINIYPKPDAHARRLGHGLNGDRVTILEQVGSNEGYTWNYVQLDTPPHLEGWVQQQFISLQSNPSGLTEQPNQEHEDWGNDYFGKRQNSYQNDQRRSQRQNDYNSYQN